MGVQEKAAIQILTPAFISVVKQTKSRSKHTHTALSSASQTWMISSKEVAKLIKSPPPFRRSPVLGEKPDVITYTQCVRTCVSPLCTIRVEGEAAGSLRFGGVCVYVCMGRVLEKVWKQQQQMFIISHTHAHAQCYRHISPDSYDEPSRFMQKIVSFLPTPLQLKWIFISVTSSSYP